MWDDIYGDSWGGGLGDTWGDQPGDYDMPTNPQTPGAFGGFSGWLSGLTGALKDSGLAKLLGGTGDLGKPGQFAAFGGLAALMNRMMSEPDKPVGYQGGIPLYTAVRTQTPIAQQRPAGYRPGQGGITYFNPIQYTYQGQDIRPPSAAALPTPPDSESPGGNPNPNTETVQAAAGGQLNGGIAMLSKGRYLKGKGDGVSDDIPARFVGSGQEARLADGEFVIPARVVAEIGNGSSDAGAKKLYAMLDRVEARARKAKRGKPSGADRELNRLA